MTTQDRARLLQIAAFALSHGETVAQAESRMLDYVPAIEVSEVNRILSDARKAINAAELINRGLIDMANTVLAQLQGYGEGQMRSLVKVKIGPGVNDWRSVVVYSNVGEAGKGALDAAKRGAAAMLKDNYGMDSGEGGEPPSIAYTGPAGF